MKLRPILVSIIVLFLYSCDDGGLLIEPDISNRSVVLLAPADGVEVSSTTVFFDWEEVEDATSYEIQVATPDFDNTQQLLLNTEDSITFKELNMNVGNYEWRVRAKNSNYSTEYSSARFSIVPVPNFSGNTVLLIAPQNNLVTNEESQLLQWNSVEGATLYRTQVIEIGGNVLQELATQDTTLQVTFTEGERIWKVRAENGIETTLYTARNILIDITNPNVPQLTAPADGSVLNSQDVTFEWTRDPISGSNELDSLFVYRDVNLTDLVIKEQVNSPYSTNLDNDEYSWFMRAYDEAGNLSNDSAVFNFTVNE